MHGRRRRGDRRRHHTGDHRLEHGLVDGERTGDRSAERNLNRFTIAVALLWTTVIVVLGVLQRFDI